nr:ribonuclease H-like domain, reverse transcriptase, RNA-dependent DNA polymerase [Tanacetum cinerariifolium]
MAGDDTTNTTTPLKPVTPIAQYQCPKLKSTNYTVWAIQIKVILKAHDLWEAIEPKKNTQVDNKKDKATTAFIYQALTEDVILQVAGCKTAKELWESLKKRHVGEEKVQQARLQSLMIGFQTLQIKEDDTMDAFTAKLNGYATKAKELGKTLDESLLVRKLLDSTPDRFIKIVASIEQTNDLDDITLEEIVGKLKAFEERIKLRKEGQVESQENLLFAHGEHSGKGIRFSKRGGHLNFDYINKMTRKGLVEGILRINHAGQIYDACLLGKHTRTPFPNQAKFRSKNPLDLVYGDLCGPISPATHSGKKLIFLLVDDCTRFMWAYFLTSKDQAFSTFKEFRQHIEMEMRMKLRMLRINKGGEFTSNEFTKYCKENGKARKLTMPYSPQQNGVLERRNRTVLSTTSSIMKAMKLPLTFWAEAVKHSIYILNKETSTQDTFLASFVVEGVDNKNPTPVNMENNDNTYQEQEPITDPDSPITPQAYTYNPNLEEEEEVTISSLGSSDHKFDDTPKREEPRNYKEASKDEKWIEAMEIELDSINKNNIWTLTTLPMNQKAIGLKWVFKTKRDAKGKIIKYKALLVAKGYVQEQGIEFYEVFAPVARIEIIHLILALATYHGWQVHHLDVKLAFLHGDLKEEVYVTQPEGFIQKGNSGKVYKLTKALYGLRQAPRAWNVKLDQTLKSLDFKKCNLEQAVYTKRSKTSILIVGVYTRGVITIRQTCYINKILKETSMMESNDTKIPMDPGTKLIKAKDGNSVDATYYQSLIGSLRYLLHTRPDLSYSVGLLSRFMQDPKDHHLKAVKQAIRYIKGTKEHGIIYKKEGGYKITGYSDSSYGINTDQGKGTTRIVFYFGESPIT